MPIDFASRNVRLVRRLKVLEVNYNKKTKGWQLIVSL